MFFVLLKKSNIRLKSYLWNWITLQLLYIEKNSLSIDEGIGKSGIIFYRG